MNRKYVYRDTRTYAHLLMELLTFTSLQSTYISPKYTRYLSRILNREQRRRLIRLPLRYIVVRCSVTYRRHIIITRFNEEFFVYFCAVNGKIGQFLFLISLISRYNLINLDVYTHGARTLKRKPALYPNASHVSFGDVPIFFCS